MVDNQELRGPTPTEETGLPTHYPTEIYDPQTTPWESIRDDILRIEQSHFGENAFREETFQKSFANSDCIVVLLRDPRTHHVIWFTYTSPADTAYDNTFHPERLPEIAQLDGKSAYVEDTAIDRDYMGKHLVGWMMQTLESELAKKGYKYIERGAATANNYAANILKTYQASGRIVYAEPEPHESKYGPQQFFRMKLPSPGK